MEETPKSAVEETVVSLLADPAALPVLVSPAADDEGSHLSHTKMHSNP